MTVCPLKCCTVVSSVTFLNSIEVMVSGHYHVELGPQQRPSSHVLGSEMVPPEKLKHTGDMSKVTEILAGRAGTPMTVLYQLEQLANFQLLVHHMGSAIQMEQWR